MSDERARQIADYENALQLPLPESVRRDIEVKLEHLRAEGANLAIANTVGRDLNQGAINLYPIRIKLKVKEALVASWCCLTARYRQELPNEHDTTGQPSLATVDD